MHARSVDVVRLVVKRDAAHASNVHRAVVEVERDLRVCTM